MFLDLYLSIGLIFLMSVIFQIINFNKIFFIYEWYDKFSKFTKKKPSEREFRTSLEWNIYRRTSVLITFDTFWILCLIFTKFFIFSIFYIIYLFLLKNTILKNHRYTYFGKISTFSIIFVKLLIIIFIYIKLFNVKLF
jgi:hypothetical protein